MEVKYDRNHHCGATPEQRIASRLRNSGDEKNADVIVQKGDGPTRTFTNVHSSGQGGAAGRVDLERGGIKGGLGAPEEPGIDGSKRGVVR